MLLLLLFCALSPTIVVCRLSITNAGTRDKINKYFKDDIKAFTKEWRKYQISHETALQILLEEVYGREVDVLIQKEPNSIVIANGILVNDNTVKLVIGKTVLKELPRMKMPEVSFRMSENVLRTEGVLTKFIATSNYRLFRNYTTFLDDRLEMDPAKHSPFTSHQVLSRGNITIIADNCRMISSAIIRLTGETVSVGHDTTFLEGCQLSIEVYSDGTGAPPVIEPYFPPKKAKEIMRIFGQPARFTLRPALLAALYTQLNGSAILQDRLIKQKALQRKLFTVTDQYFIKLVSKLNQYTYAHKSVALTVPDYSIAVIEQVLGEDVTYSIHLENMRLYGVDEAYSARSGGAFQLTKPLVAEAIRFTKLQVQGIIADTYGKYTTDFNFAADLLDVNIDVVLDLQEKAFPKLYFSGWRVCQFSIIDVENDKVTRYDLHALVEGYLSEVLPKLLLDYLAKALPEALIMVDNNDGPPTVTTEEDSWEEICTKVKKNRTKTTPVTQTTAILEKTEQFQVHVKYVVEKEANNEVSN